MTLTLVTLTADPATLVGADPSSAVRFTVRTNAGGAIIDADDNKIYLGTHSVNVAGGNTFSATLPPTNGATNPTAFQYTVDVEYVDAATKKRTTWSSGWFSLTADADLADVAAEAYVPPTWMTTATATLQGYVDQGEDLLAQQETISGLTGEDAAITAIDNNASSAFRVQQDARHSATIAGAVAQMDVTGKTAAEINTWLHTPTALGLLKRMIGDVTVAGSLTLLSNTWLDATGASVRSTDGTPPIYAESKTNVTVIGAHVDVAGVDLSGKGAIRFKNCDASAVEKCTFDEPANNSASIELEGCTNSTVERNRISGGGYGIIVGSLSVNGSPETNNNIISRNHIDGCALNGIFVTASLASSATTVVGHGNEVVNNVVRNCGDVGIETGTGMRYTKISGNYVTGSTGPNILIRDNIGTDVIGNTANGNTVWASNYGGGILVADQNSASSDITISNNTCDSNTGPGIRVGSSIDDLVISGNKCRLNAQEGIFTNGAGDVSITANHTKGNGGYGGIVIGGRGDNTANMAVTGNISVGNPVGIAVYGQDVTLTGNQCRNNTAQGILIEGTQANYVTAVGNACRGNGHATEDITVTGGPTGVKVAYNQGRYTQVGAA